ncbi:nuclear transport factor 2 family protein [Rhizorhabdus dicambivorans]|nr:nuclear transport factor 2 family protein [Rhizorhabdus dicambivorans]
MRHEEIDIAVEELLDREKIRHNLARYSRGMDRQDADLIASTYWPEGWDDHGMIAADGRAWADGMKPMWPTLKMGHMLGQSCIEIHGNFANCETYFFAYHRMGEGTATRDVHLGGRYADRLEKREGKWKFIHRVAIYDWSRSAGPSEPWDDVLFPFSAMPSRSYGAQADDYSWELFANEPSKKGTEYPVGPAGRK